LDIQLGHATWTSIVDNSAGDMDKEHGHAALAFRGNIQYGDA
jgi:hypothetical protein